MMTTMKNLRKVKPSKPGIFTSIFDGVEKVTKTVKRYRKLPLLPPKGGKEGYIPRKRKRRKVK